MKRNDSILIFFLLLAAACWNPLTFYWFYEGKPGGDSNWLKAFFYAVPIMFAIVSVILKNRPVRMFWANALFSMSVLFILMGLLVVVNHLLGYVQTSDQSDFSRNGFIFKPFEKVTYSTSEFRNTADINSIGLRDVEIKPEKGNAYRILCFGDSWTFGWGVGLDDSWPRKLMHNLREKGYDRVEVINCGQPGKHTSDYLRNMKAVIPNLKADLVLVGVLQLDDLAQLYEGKYMKHQAQLPFRERLGLLAKDFLESSFGNYQKYLGYSKAQDTICIHDIWEKNMHQIMDGLDRSRRQRFLRLDDTVRSMFMSVDLNPTLLKRYLDFPDRSFVFNNPQHPATLEAIEMMRKNLKGMKELCHSHGLQIVFVNMPYNEFTGHKVVRTPLDAAVGFLRENNRIDSVYEHLAAEARMDYIELTDHFLQLQPKDRFFFLYDGHPTRDGYREIAAYIGEVLVSRGYLR